MALATKTEILSGEWSLDGSGLSEIFASGADERSGEWSLDGSALSVLVEAAGGATYNLKYHNGTSWVGKPLKWWNGSAWVAKELKASW